MKYSEMKQVVEMLVNEWNLGKKECGATGNICGWIYLFEVLEESEKIITYKDGKKIVGLIAYSKNESNKNLLKKKFYNIIKNKLYKSKNIKDTNALKDYKNNYDYLPNELKDYFDGEILILIVDKNYRGKNIGKRLLSEAFDLAKKDNIKNLQILTDESCNYKFYEICGCKKVYETIVKNKEYGKSNRISNEKAFIYEKEL